MTTVQRKTRSTQVTGRPSETTRIQATRQLVRRDGGIVFNQQILAPEMLTITGNVYGKMSTNILADGQDLGNLEDRSFGG